MSKKTILIILILFFITGPCYTGVAFAQQLPESINTDNNTLEPSFNEENQDVLVIPADTDIVHLETMMSSDEKSAMIISAFEMMNIEGAQEIIEAYLNNGYSLAEIGEILKNANFSLEDVFQAMLNELGPESLQEIVGALLAAKFDSGDVFKVAINHLKQVNSELTDQQIIETILGEAIDPDLFKGLMQEIFIEKISSVSYSLKRDLVLGMIEAGFTLEEITASLAENGFRLDQIAKIYGLADIAIGFTYDLLINVQGGQEIVDVLSALLASSYNVASVFECLVSKLSETHSIEEITAIVIGEVGEEGPTSDQINNAIILSGVMQDNETSVVQICEALLTAGFDLENTATVLNGIGVILNEAFSTLLNALGGQNAADVAIALISNGYGTHEVFVLSVPALKNQGFGLTEIISLLIGEIDSEDGASKEQMENALLLVDVMINAGDSLAAISVSFMANGFSLGNTADLLKDNEVAVEDAYNALVGALGGEHAIVAVAMTEAGFSIDTVIDLAVADLKALDISDVDIISMLVESVEENKNPGSKQFSRASVLIELLVSQEGSLSEMGETLFDIGFSLNIVAKVLKKASVSLEDAFAVILGIVGGDDQEYDTVCSSLKAGGYNSTRVYEKAVTDLKAEGYSVAEIIDILIGVIDSEDGPTSTQTNNASYLVKFLIADGVPLQEMCEAFLDMDLSIKDIAKIMKKASVEIEDIFSALMNSSGGQDIIEVCTAMIAAGYKANDTFEIIVAELKSQGHDVQTIINMLIGPVDVEFGISSFQKKNASYLISVLSEESSLSDICEGFLNVGFSISEIAYQTKKAKIGLLEIYTALVNANQGQEPVAVINSLNEAGYEMSDLFQMVVPELLDQNYSIEDIITMFIGEVDQENGLTSKQLLNTSILIEVLTAAGESIGDICTALAAAGVSLEDNAKIVYSMEVNFTQAYELLLNAYGGSDVAGVALAMIKARYDIDSVLDMVIPVLEAEGKNMSEIVGLLLGEVSIDNGPTDFQLNMAAKLVEVFTDKGEVLADIADDLFSAGITLENIATILKGINIEFEEAYEILTKLGAGQDIINVAMALIDAGYDSETVITTVVRVLLSDDNYTNLQIIESFIGTVDPENGPTSTQELWASFLVVEFEAEVGGDSLEDICADLGTAGFTLQSVASVLQSVEISAVDAFDLLLNFDEGQDALDVALALISGNYSSDDVYVLLVTSLGQGHTEAEIIAMVIGEIDSEDGLSSEQLGKARDLTKAFKAIGGTSLELIATGLLNHGFTLDQTVIVFKLAEIEIEETYTTLLATYQPEENEGLGLEGVVCASMISMGYDSFNLYSFVVEELEDDGITDKTEIVKILIGEFDPDDSQQISNAAKLSKVLDYNIDKKSAENTVESWVDLFNNGYSFEKISQMLMENGFTQGEIDAKFSEGFNEIIEEMTKSGKSASYIVMLVLTQENKAEYLRPLAEQLILNDFSSHTVTYAILLGSGGLNKDDNANLKAGIADAGGYRIENTAEAAMVNYMLTSEGGNCTLTEISEYFAEEGYQMSFVAKLFKTLGESMEDIFIALEESKASYSSELLINDNVAVIVLLPYYIDKDLFAVAAQYYKDEGLSSEEIILKLMSAEVNIDSTSVLADTIIGEYYKSITQLQGQSFVTLMHAGYSIVWITETLMEKDIDLDVIEAFIADNFSEIYQGLRNVRVSASSIVNYFKVEDSPGEYTVLLAENMIKDDIGEEEVRNILLGYNADPDLIDEGISRGLAYLDSLN